MKFFDVHHNEMALFRGREHLVDLQHPPRDKLLASGALSTEGQHGGQSPLRDLDVLDVRMAGIELKIKVVKRALAGNTDGEDDVVLPGLRGDDLGRNHLVRHGIVEQARAERKLAHGPQPRGTKIDAH
jgi:hypothetical protein